MYLEATVACRYNDVWLREKESNLQFRSQSPTCCQLHHPARNSGHWDSNPEPCADLALTPLIRRLLYQLSYAPLRLVAAEGIEPSSLDYRSSALPLGYTAMVDPAGLKPAPHGLKGRCSVARAPDRKTGCGGRTRTFDTRINNPVPYQLGYATKNCLREQESNLR